MIQSRNSESYLHSDVILSEISEEDIFRYYCPNFKALGVKFCSDLRKDSRPSVSIALIGNNLLYKDFGYDGHTFNCFGYVMQKFNISFIEALKLIASDFSLKLTTSAPTVKTASLIDVESYYPRKHSKIQIKSRDWDKRDYYYWGVKYQISKKTLIKYNIHPITYFWVNSTRFKVKSIGYAFKFDKGYKIYQPNEIDTKWFSNVGGDVIQGYDQLPANGGILIITSSLKDVLVLDTMGFLAVAPQSERVMSEKVISEFKDRFRNIVVLYDNDFDSEINPGQTAALKMCQKYNLDNIVLDEKYKSKDISDLVDNHGFEFAKEKLTTIIENIYGPEQEKN